MATYVIVDGPVVGEFRGVLASYCCADIECPCADDPARCNSGYGDWEIESVLEGTESNEGLIARGKTIEAARRLRIPFYEE